MRRDSLTGAGEARAVEPVNETDRKVSRYGSCTGSKSYSAGWRGLDHGLALQERTVCRACSTRSSLPQKPKKTCWRCEQMSAPKSWMLSRPISAMSRKRPARAGSSDSRGWNGRSIGYGSVIFERSTMCSMKVKAAMSRFLPSAQRMRRCSGLLNMGERRNDPDSTQPGKR